MTPLFSLESEENISFNFFFRWQILGLTHGLPGIFGCATWGHEGREISRLKLSVAYGEAFFEGHKFTAFRPTDGESKGHMQPTALTAYFNGLGSEMVKAGGKKNLYDIETNTQ